MPITNLPGVNSSEEIALLSQEGSVIATRPREGWFRSRHASVSQPLVIRISSVRKADVSVRMCQ
jgi:hypothetical protein